tara:strand:+ start:322 stop:504 length:183 start_codon:yes stop_codon:yes gene_type:complete
MKRKTMIKLKETVKCKECNLNADIEISSTHCCYCDSPLNAEQVLSALVALQSLSARQGGL